MTVHNVHERRFPGHTTREVARLLDTVGSSGDRLWPTRFGNFPAMRLDGPLADRPSGGHGLVRYHVESYDPGSQVTFRFGDIGLDGTHRLEVLAGDTPGLRHTIDAQPRGVMRLAWPLAVRWLHDACLEELLDVAEAELAAQTPELRRHGAWVRLLLRIGPSPAAEEAKLAAAGSQ